MSAEPLLDQAAAAGIATRIGFGIARRALWSGGRCTWLEAIPVMPGQNPAQSALCGPDLYGGTAGIGWFLAELASRFPDPFLRRTAEAALRQTIARVDRHAEAAPHGFYGGAAGAGAALVLAGRNLGLDEAVEAGRALLLRLPLAPTAPDGTDLVSGLAGTILSLCAAGGALADAALIARGRSAAENLLAMAVRGPDDALSWPSMAGTRANLTGFAHGTAGIAHALLQLDALAPDAVLRDAAAAAFAYEAASFDPDHGGWPDYRLLPGYPADQIFYPIAWCHGAAGIAQGRLAAAARGMEVAAALNAGFAATAAEAARLILATEIDLTLCHGLLGLADALLDARRTGLTTGAEALAAIVRRAAIWDETEQPWPSGLLTREELSGLMMGNAGIGWFFLRVADPGLGSILVPLAPV
jgi:lantibiotic modifying enzyme